MGKKNRRQAPLVIPSNLKLLDSYEKKMILAVILYVSSTTADRKAGNRVLALQGPDQGRSW